MNSKVLFFTNVFPHYREALWEKLVSSKDFELHFYFSNISKFGIKVGEYKSNRFLDYKDRFHIIRNYYIGKYLFWQSTATYIAAFSNYDSIIFTGESQVLSTWIASIIGRIRNKKVVFWGHGIYGNEKGVKRAIRTLFNKIPNYHFVYELRAKDLMLKQAISMSKIEVIYNSLDYELQKKLYLNNRTIKKEELLSFFVNPNNKTLIFSGRLNKSKRLDLLINSLKTLNRNRVNYNLLIIGEGSEMNSLISLGKSGIDEKWLHFYGSCYDENILSLLFIASDLCVSPGNVGLLAVHSLSYGTPVCTHSNFENQNPEVQVVKEGYTGVYFIFNDVDSLSKVIENFNYELKYSSNCREIIDKYYNPNYQYSVFKKVICS